MKTTRALCLVLLVAAVGCGSKKSKGGVIAPSTASTAATTTATTTTTTTPATTTPPTNTTTPPVVVTQPTTPSTPLQNALNLINQARANLGLKPLVLDAALTACAYQHSVNWANYSNFSVAGSAQFAHKDFLAGDRCNALAENQGVGPGDLNTGYKFVFDSFLAEGPPKPGECNHYGNMLNPLYTRVGIGLYEANGYVWVTQLFR